MVYSGGQLVAEYDLTNGSLKKEYIYGAKGLLATIEPGTGTRYTTSDHLGSPRVVTNSSAGVVSRHDYMPFGEELGSGVGGRTTGMGFVVNDGVRQKFTSYERDVETTLDFAEARYYSTLQGRFTSVDSLTASATTANPQTLNRYTYVNNRPLSSIDPTGMFGMNPGGCVGGDLPLWSIAPDGEEVQQKPKPKPERDLTVDITVDPVTFDWNLAADRNKPNVGPFFTGFSSVLTIVLREDGKPVVGATGTESVTGTKGEKIEQNPRGVTTNEKGEIFDLVTRGAIENFKVDRNIAVAVFNENSNRPVDVKTLQTITVDLPGGGAAEIKFERRMTNLDKNGNVRPPGQRGSPLGSNFTVTVGTPTVRQLR